MYLTLPQLDDKTTADIPNGAHAHALDVLSLGLLWLALHDSIKEGDDVHLVLHLKLLLVVFKSANYRTQVVRLLATYSVPLLHLYYIQCVRPFTPANAY